VACKGSRGFFLGFETLSLLERFNQAILDVIRNPKRLKKLPVSER
jgi:hypothetical protein